MSDTLTLHRGHTPLLISFPHVGTDIPESLKQLYTPRALMVEDTDWFLDRLYGFAQALGASMLIPRFSRYVVDLNRSSDNAPMYPGQNNTELCPTRHFTGEALHLEGKAPGEEQIQDRVDTYWRPYHDTLQAELQAIRQRHGHAVLFDAHSIQSRLPWLFEGELPHMNVGTAQGAACDAGLQSQVAAVFAAQDTYSHVLNGRFKGGHITRHFGRPPEGIHAVQLEMCWRAYMEETPPYRWHDARAAAVTPLLARLVHTLIAWKPSA